MVQDGTDSILKSKYVYVNEFEIRHQKLIEDNTNKFTPEMNVVCEVPPVVKKEEAIFKVDLYNDYLKVLSNSKPGLQVVKFNPMLKKNQ